MIITYLEHRIRNHLDGDAADPIAGETTAAAARCLDGDNSVQVGKHHLDGSIGRAKDLLESVNRMEGKERGTYPCDPSAVAKMVVEVVSGIPAAFGVCKDGVLIPLHLHRALCKPLLHTDMHQPSICVPG
jgi:hypothetical protein